MGDTTINWVARRVAFESDIPSYWSRLCVDLRDAVATFDKECSWGAGFDGSEVITKNGCFHVDLKPHGHSKVGVNARSVDVCLDQRRRMVVATVDGTVITSLSLKSAANGTAHAVDSTGEQLTNDQVSQELLGKFLFPEGV